MDAEKTIHQNLWQFCESKGIKFVLHSLETDEHDPGDAADSFSPGVYGRNPTIRLWRGETADVVEDYTAETITLAHEFGHYLSWESGHHTPELDEAYAKNRENYDGEYGGQSLNDLHLVLAEEELAWAFARSVLAHLGFTSWSRFEQQKTLCLDTYMCRLRYQRTK